MLSISLLASRRWPRPEQGDRTWSTSLPPRQTAPLRLPTCVGITLPLRTLDLETAKRWYVEKLDFRGVAEWDYADEQLAYIAPSTDDHFYIEILGGGEPTPQDVRPYTDLGDSLKRSGYHYFCPNVTSVNGTVEKQPLARRHHRDRAVRVARDQPATRLLLRSRSAISSSWPRCLRARLSPRQHFLNLQSVIGLCKKAPQRLLNNQIVWIEGKRTP